MTPAFATAYDLLLARAADAGFADLVAPMREAFARKVGPFASTDAWFEERSAALWDRVLTQPVVLERMRGAETRDELRAAMDSLARAQRGLFEVHTVSGDVDLVCLASGAAFRLSRIDEAGRALGSGRGTEDDVAPGVVDARVVPTREGVCMLPGMLVHAAEATPQIVDVLAHGRALGLADDDLFDALLSMRHRLASLSRMKPKQIYRADLLNARSPSR